MGELTTHFQNVCDKIQDSIMVIESIMGSNQQFSFDIRREIYALNSMDLHSTGEAVDQ